MITVEHDWVSTDPPRIGATVCRQCGTLCDTRRDGGPFFDAKDQPLGMTPPDCPLIPPSNHTKGPWHAYDNGTCWQIDAELHAVVTTQFCYARETEANALLIARAPAMRDALEATLLFYRAGHWDTQCRDRWIELTGTREATTRVLCDTVRKALR